MRRWSGFEEPLGVFSPLSGNLDPVCAQEWLEEGKANYGIDESGRWPKA